ncbi:hypothetical protein C8Q74DRAFT_1363426 [Fomes fomentarius]|nr:hypothetical protein C8Q74DRAFT_1363426 [Fomes fomentarius]
MPRARSDDFVVPEFTRCGDLRNHIPPNGVQWDLLASRVRNYLQLPDTETRSGLKKVHSQFSETWTTLDAYYTKARELRNRLTVGTIVEVWGKMCADALLRDKLLAAGGRDIGVVAKVLPLLQEGDAFIALLVLKLLVLVTHHGGVDARLEVSRHHRVIIQCHQNHFRDPEIAIPAVIILRFALASVIAPHVAHNPTLLAQIQIIPVLQGVVETLRYHRGSLVVFQHGIHLISHATLRYSKECLTMPSLLSLLVAFTRSKNVVIRCIAIRSLIRIHSPLELAEVPQSCKVPIKQKRTVFQRAARRELPPDLQREADAYGIERCESTLTTECYTRFPECIHECLERGDSDLCTLGIKLADIIILSQCAMIDGEIQLVHNEATTSDGTAANTPDDSGLVLYVLISDAHDLPFTRVSEMLLHCAEALRIRGAEGDLDVADFLELWYLIQRGEFTKAASLGERVVQRNPGLAYAHYAISIGPNVLNHPRAIRKAMRCQDVHPSLKYHLLLQAVDEHAEASSWVLGELEGNDYQIKVGVSLALHAKALATQFYGGSPTGCALESHLY